MVDSPKQLEQPKFAINGAIYTVQATAGHYGFLYEVKRGFRRIEPQILNARSHRF